MRITQHDDEEEAREIHSLAFPGDFWVGGDHTFWVAREGDRVIGFCSAKKEGDDVFLSRAAVVRPWSGCGLHRTLIRKRVKWAIAEGATRVHTYTSMKNYKSMVNLLRCGFRFYDSDWCGPNVHYFEVRLK